LRSGCQNAFGCGQPQGARAASPGNEAQSSQIIHNMKYLICGSFLFLNILVFAQDKKIVKGKIDEVTVYFNGATVSQSAKVSLAQGVHSLVFERLPANIDQTKSSIYTPDDVTVLSMQRETSAAEENNSDASLKKINDSIRLVAVLQKSTAYKIDALNTELDLLKRNLYIGGSNSGVNITELQKATELYRVRQDDIYKKLLAESQAREELDNTSAELQKRRQLVLFELERLSSRIIVQVKVLKDGAYDIRLKYFTTNAAWKPIYDIRVEDVGKPMELVQKGKIQNNTGQDWKNVKMMLSTADPSMSIIRPELAVWELGYELRVTPPFSHRSGDYSDNVFQGNISTAKTENVTLVNVSELSNEFTIAEPVNMISSLMTQTIEIKSYTLNAWYEYTSIPKIEKLPWLIGKTTDWKNIPLSDGPANIYIGNNYIGESYINIGTVSDTLEISLGRNKKVVVDYRKKEDMTRKAWLGSTVTESFTYEINIKNNNNLDIVFELWDQLPVSKNKEIEVGYSEISGAALDPQTGRLTWKYTLKPGEEKKIILSYTVKYPKDKPVVMKRFKPLRAPDF
jgi:uncharacterized protein (TIGR02231 family)